MSNYSGTREDALGNSSVNIVSIWSAKNNPGSFSFMAQSEASVVYRNRFLINELSTQSLAFGYHSQKGNLGVFIQHSGFDLFRTMQIGGVYGIELSPKLGMGLAFNYHQTRFGDIYGVRHHFLANLGVQYRLSKTIFIGASAQNINRSKLSDFENERLPTLFTIGILYKVSSKVLWLIDLEKEITSQFNLKSGLELEAHDNFKIRLGVNSYPFQSSFGFGISINKLQIDVAGIWHAHIGLTPSLGLVYTF